MSTGSGSRPTVLRLVSAATGASVFTIVALGYAVALADGEWPQTHPWPLASLASLGFVLFAGAFQNRPNVVLWIVAIGALLSGGIWFSTLL